MDLGLKDKVVIVTGGSGGIGRGLVLAFAAEGARVVIATRDEAKAAEVAAAAAEGSCDDAAADADAGRRNGAEERPGPGGEERPGRRQQQRRQRLYTRLGYDRRKRRR